VAPPDTPLAEAHRRSLGQLAGQSFMSLPLQEAACSPIDCADSPAPSVSSTDIVQVARPHRPLALVSAEAGHLTLASVARNIDDPHVVFVAVNELTPILDDHLRAAWRRDDKSLAFRRCWMNCSPSTTQRRGEVKKSHNSVVILECNVLIARLDPRRRRC
jgi:hypothetical protein